MSINRLIEDTYKPWLNIRANNLTLDGDLITPSVSLSDQFTISNATPDLRRCYVTKVGKLYTFIFHIKLTNVAAGQVSTITIQPAGLAKIPGYQAADINLNQISVAFKHTPKPGAAGDIFGIRAVQNSSTFEIVKYGANTGYPWDALDIDSLIDLSCTIQVQAV
jgi:hypothetical protein